MRRLSGWSIEMLLAYLYWKVAAFAAERTTLMPASVAAAPAAKRLRESDLVNAVNLSKVSGLEGPLVEHDAAVDGQRFAVHERRCGRKKPGDSLGDFQRFGAATDERQRFDARARLGILEVSGEHRR